MILSGFSTPKKQGSHPNLGATACLPDVQGEVVIQLTHNHLVAGSHNQVTLLLGNHPKVKVCQGRSLQKNTHTKGNIQTEEKRGRRCGAWEGSLLTFVMVPKALIMAMHIE